MSCTTTAPCVFPLQYQRLKIRSALAVPIKPRPTGFLVVRNTQRYLYQSSMLQMLAFVLLASINEQKLMQSMKMTLSPDSIERDTDVIINLFGIWKSTPLKAFCVSLT